MTASDRLTRERILTVVRGWPVAERLALLQEVLRTLEEGAQPTSERRASLDRALGLAATDNPAPDDATVDVWREERREQKYGG